MKKTLGQKLKEARLKQQMTSKQLAGNFMTVDLLKQIEEDKICPSKTMINYLRDKLSLEPAFFDGAIVELQAEKDLTNQLMVMYEQKKYKDLIEMLDEMKLTSQTIFYSEFIQNLYINCHFRWASDLLYEKEIQKALIHYKALLFFEDFLLLDQELIAYELYSKLMETYTLSGDLDQSILYKQKAKTLLQKLISNEKVIRLYEYLMTASLDEALDLSDKVDYEGLDEYNKARFDMIIGQLYSNKQAPKEAIRHLEKAASFYEKKTRGNLVVIVYEELARCYSQMDQHERALLYMKKSMEARVNYD